MSSSLSASSIAIIAFVLGSADLVVVVDRWFALSWSRCPLVMAMERGEYFLTRLDVSSGHVVNQPLSIALHHVDRTGEKQHA